MKTRSVQAFLYYKKKLRTSAGSLVGGKIDQNIIWNYYYEQIKLKTPALLDPS